MAKKDLDKMDAAELRATLKEEREASDKAQKASEDRQREADDKARADSREADRVRRDADASKNTEPSEEQWIKLEAEYDMERADIRKTWKVANAATRGLAAELQTFKVKEAASEAVRAAKIKALGDDAQFPKLEKHVDEYLGDLSLADRADPAKLEKHMERAVNYARGKASKAGSYRDEQDHDSTRDGMTQEQKDDEKAGFGRMEISGMPLTIDVEKRVPDDFRKLHSHPEKEGAVQMKERARWNAAIPVKPR